MDDIVNVVNNLYDSIMENGLDDYQNHLIDISLFLSNILKKESIPNKLYNSILELINLTSVFDIKNQRLISSLLTLRMCMIDYKLYNKKANKESLNKIFCHEFRKIFKNDK